MNEEEFNAIAYNYRSWPAHDIKGVADRYDELVNYVQSIAHLAKTLTNEEILELWDWDSGEILATDLLDFADAILRKAQEK